MDPRQKGTWDYLTGPETPSLNSLSQLADWRESYAKTMELNVWTSSTVTSAEKDASGTWIVHLTRILSDGTETKRVLRATHLVCALGFGAGVWSIPKYPKQVLLFRVSSCSRTPG